MTLIDKNDVMHLFDDMEWDVEDKYEIKDSEAISSIRFIIHELQRRTYDIAPVDAIPTDWLEKWLVEQVKNEDIKAVMVVAKLLVDWGRDVKR